MTTIKIKMKVKTVRPMDQIRAHDASWLKLGELREMVRRADELGWTDSSLVSHSYGGSEHPDLAGLRCATTIVIEGGPS